MFSLWQWLSMFTDRILDSDWCGTQPLPLRVPNRHTVAVISNTESAHIFQQNGIRWTVQGLELNYIHQTVFFVVVVVVVVWNEEGEISLCRRMNQKHFILKLFLFELKLPLLLDFNGFGYFCLWLWNCIFAMLLILPRSIPFLLSCHQSTRPPPPRAKGPPPDIHINQSQSMSNDLWNLCNKKYHPKR